MMKSNENSDQEFIILTFKFDFKSEFHYSIFIKLNHTLDLMAKLCSSPFHFHSNFRLIKYLMGVCPVNQLAPNIYCVHPKRHSILKSLSFKEFSGLMKLCRSEASLSPRFIIVSVLPFLNSNFDAV